MPLSQLLSLVADSNLLNLLTQNIQNTVGLVSENTKKENVCFIDKST